MSTEEASDLVRPPNKAIKIISLHLNNQNGDSNVLQSDTNGLSMR